MRSLKTAFKNIRRTPYQALAASLVLSLTFFALSVFVLISAGFHMIFLHFESAPQVIAFFEKGKDLPQQELDRIRTGLAQTNKLESFEYISTKQAEEIYKQKNRNDPLLNELVDYKILPPSIEIAATEIAALPMLKDMLEQEPLVEEITFYDDIVDTLNTWLVNVRLLGTALIGFLLIMSLLILIIIIGFKVKNKRIEIEILRLLGGSGWYIYGPFIYEGMMYGLVGAFFGWLASFTVLQYATPMLITYLEGILTLPVDFVSLLMLLGVMSMGGMVLGGIGSMLAVHRFVKI